MVFVCFYCGFLGFVVVVCLFVCFVFRGGGGVLFLVWGFVGVLFVRF